MLLMLFKNFLWAAWWPYYTMLLAMEKAAAEQAAATRARSQQEKPQGAPGPEPRNTPPPRRDPARPAERKMPFPMAAVAPEISPALRELMKLSIDQARRGFETFVATSEKAWKALESASPAGHPGLFALNAKIVEITRLNAEANFALAARLAETKDLSQAIELQNRHVNQQMETFVRQLEEMRDLAAMMVQEANSGWIDAGVRTASAHAPWSSADAGGRGASPYAPSSSFTPGARGRPL
jgi:hypothetical protein